MNKETNPLVLSGEFTRVYVSELMPGEIDAFGDTIDYVYCSEDDKWAKIVFTNDSTVYCRPDSTILIQTDSLKD